MDAGEAVKIFESKVIEVINESGLHPVVVRLVLMNLMNLIEKQEQQKHDIAFTPEQLAAGLLGLAAALVSLWAAFKAVLEIVEVLKKPNEEQNARIDKLEVNMADVQKMLDNENKRLMEQQNANHAVMTALQALLSHGINGNNVDEMRKANSAVNEYLVSRKQRSGIHENYDLD